MPLSSNLIDHLFAKLAVRYGAAFIRQWPDTNPSLVKADWAEVLDGTSGAAIEYALDNVPRDWPPNAMQFLALCRVWQGSTKTLALPEPQERADPSRISDALLRMNALRAELKEQNPAQYCIERIEAVVGSRSGKISVAQRHIVSHCLRMPETNTTLPVQQEMRLP